MKSEAKIQQEIWLYFRQQYPKYICHSVPNGIGISIPKDKIGRWLIPVQFHKIIREMISKSVNFLKQTGMSPGISDLIVHLPGGRAVMVEVKDSTNSQDPPQKRIEEKIKTMNGNYILVRSVEDFAEQIKKFIL